MFYERPTSTFVLFTYILPENLFLLDFLPLWHVFSLINAWSVSYSNISAPFGFFFWAIIIAFCTWIYKISACKIKDWQNDSELKSAFQNGNFFNSKQILLLSVPSIFQKVLWIWSIEKSLLLFPWHFEN